MENKPTSAPWTSQIDPVDQDIMILAEGRKNGGFLIGRAYGPDRVANAALIAAAPKLLDENQRLRKALELCRDVLSNTASAYHENSKLHSIFDMLCDLNEQK